MQSRREGARGMARHILVTLDTYGRSDHVLARVCLLARHFHSTVSLLMVSTLERESVSSGPATQQRRTRWHP